MYPCSGHSRHRRGEGRRREGTGGGWDWRGGREEVRQGETIVETPQKRFKTIEAWGL